MSYLASDLINFCLSKVGLDYVYGAWGQILTKDMVDSWASSYPNMYTSAYKEKAYAKIGRPCADCSGLISWFTGNRVSSTWFNNNAMKRIPISKIKDCMPGSILWKSGHVGVYIGMENGVPRAVEARGIDYGIIKSNVSAVKWTYVLMMSDCTYDVPSGSEVDISDIDNETFVGSNDPDSPEYSPIYDSDEGVFVMGGSLAYQKFQIGDNLAAYIYQNSWTDCNITIDGYGYMFDSIDDFKAHFYKEQTYENEWFYWAGRCKGNLVIPDGVQSISERFMESTDNFQAISTLYIGKDVEYIGDKAFQVISGYGVRQVISTSDVLETLGNQCFYNSNRLEYADFNGTVTNIGEGCFSGCSSMQEVKLSNKIEIIPAMAFNNCTSLRQFNEHNIIHAVEISGGSSANGIFRNCNSLENIMLSDKFDYNVDYNWHGYFHLDLNAGSNCNEDGLQITHIYTNNPKAVAYDWVGFDNRFPVFVHGSEFLYVAHKGKWVKIRGYNMIDGDIPVSHEGIYIWLKLLEQGDSMGTPVFVSNNGKWFQISY